MSLRCDSFIQTMLYTYLFYESDTKDMPLEGFKIYDDNTISYETRTGVIREVEVTDKGPGTLEFRIIDVTSNELFMLFDMKYKTAYCSKCKVLTIHAISKQKWYCTECGTYNEQENTSTLPLCE